MGRWHGPQGKGASRLPRTRPNREALVLAERAPELAALRARITHLPVRPAAVMRAIAAVKGDETP